MHWFLSWTRPPVYYEWATVGRKCQSWANGRFEKTRIGRKTETSETDAAWICQLNLAIDEPEHCVEDARLKLEQRLSRSNCEIILNFVINVFVLVFPAVGLDITHNSNFGSVVVCSCATVCTVPMGTNPFTLFVPNFTATACSWVCRNSKGACWCWLFEQRHPRTHCPCAPKFRGH